jgi:hypothetical protein
MAGDISRGFEDGDIIIICNNCHVYLPMAVYKWAAGEGAGLVMAFPCHP